MTRRHAATASVLAMLAFLVMLALPQRVLAAELCPSAEGLGSSTFAAALDSLLNKAKGKSPSGPTNPGLPGSMWAALNGKQQQEVLQELAKELSGKRVGYENDRVKSGAAKRLEDLKRRIWVRDKLERDEQVVGNRLYDRGPDGKLRPSARDSKPLSQIIDEETKKAEPSLSSKYADKYKRAIRAAVEQDPKRFAETLGSLAGGDYMSVLDHGADLGASAFSTMVGDALDELGYKDSKTVWETAVKHSGTAKTVMQAIARGDTDGAWKSLKDDAIKELKAQSKTLVSGTIDWAAKSGSSAPSVFGMTPGQAYLKLLEQEIKLIEWGKDYIRNKSDLSDGKCVRDYNAAYERFGDAGTAYGEFNECLSTSRYSGFFEFGNQARSIGLDEGAATREYLEAQRKGLRNAYDPLAWITAKVTARQKEMERRMLPQLSRTQQVMANVAEAAADATNNRLTDLIVAKLNEDQWDGLEDDIRKIEEKLDAVLGEIDEKLDRVRRNSDAINTACDDYEREKKVARQALHEGSDLSVQSAKLFERLNGMDVSVCTQPEDAGAAAASAKRGKLAARIAELQGRLAREVEDVCAAADAIRNADSKEKARGILDDALGKARAVQQISGDLNTAAGELAALDETGPAEDAAARAARRQEIAAELDAIAGEIETLAGRFGSLKTGTFDPAYQTMSQAHTRIVRLEPVTEDFNKAVRACLRPLADAPVAREPRRILAELQQRSTDAVGCRGLVDDSWTKRDVDPPVSGRMSSSAPWRSRSLDLGYPVERLRAKLAELRAQCPAGEAQAAQPLPGENGDAAAAAQEAVARMQRCVADAITAFDETWLKEPEVTAEASCDPAGNAETLGALRQAAAGDKPGAKAQLAAFEPVAANVSAAYARYEDAKSAYGAGDLPGAESSLRQALASARAAGEGICSDLIDKINAGLDKTGRLGDAVSASDRAVGQCDVSAMQSWKSKLGTVSNPAATRAAARIDQALEDCREKEEEDAIAALDGRCTSAFGDNAMADPKTLNADQPQCICKSGFKWNDDRSGCTDAPSEEELAAARNANCKKQYGGGYYAGPMSASGQYFCLPTKTTANAWCRKNNNKYHYAGKVKADGSYNCYLSDQGQQVAAIGDCRRRYGNRFIRVVKKGKQYFCEFQNPPQHNPNVSAAQAATVIQGVIGAINNGRGGGGGGGSNCHHRRTDSTQHCGSN